MNNTARKLSLVLAFLIFITACVPMIALAENDVSENKVENDPGLISGNAVVAYSIDDDQILWSNRLDESVAPTVATKLVTAMVVMDVLSENGLAASNTNAVVTQTALDNCGNIYDPRVPVMALSVNNSYTVSSLLQAMLVNNAYDAASVLAYHFGETYLGGDVDYFIDRMNKKVSSLGLTKTKFVNATGVNSSDQYTTPREVVMITKAFYGYNELVNYSNVSSFSFGRTTVRNKNFLKNDYNVAGYINNNAIGLIAGQLDRKGNYCLITATQDQGRTYIFVVMCASGMKIDPETTLWSFDENNAYDDMNKLIKWVREAFTLLEVANKDKIVGELRVDYGSSSDHVMVVPAEAVEKLVLKNGDTKISVTVKYDENVVYKKMFNGKEFDTISAPVSHGQRVGTVIFSYNGVEIATVDAVVKDGIEEDAVLSMMGKIKNFLFGKFMMTLLIIIGAIIIIYIIVVIVMAAKRGVGRARASSAKKSKDNTDKKPKKSKKDKKTSDESVPAKGKMPFGDTKEIL